MRSIAFTVLLASLIVMQDATAGDLPSGNCAAPMAATDLSLCDFSRTKLAGRDLHGVRLAGAKLESTDLRKANLAGKDVEWQRGRVTLEIKPGENDLGEIKLPPGNFRQ